MNYMKKVLMLCGLTCALTSGAMQQPVYRNQINELFTAIEQDDAPKVATILQQATNRQLLANAYYEGVISLLRHAATIGNIAIVMSLLDAGAELDPWDGYDITPLMMAVNQGNVAVTRLLVERGANVKARDKSNQTVFDYVQFGMVTPEQRQELMDMLTRAWARS